MTEQLRVQQQRVELLATATAAAAAVAATAAATAASTNTMDAESTTRDKHGLPLMDKMRVYLIKWKQGRRRVGFLCRTGEYDAVAKVQRAISLRWYKCDEHTGKFQSKDTCGVTQHGFFEGEDGSKAIEANTIITPVESFEASWDQGKIWFPCTKIGLCLAADRDQATAGGVACDTDGNSDSDSEQDQRFAISANAPLDGEILEYKIHPCNWIRMANKERF